MYSLLKIECNESCRSVITFLMKRQENSHSREEAHLKGCMCECMYVFMYMVCVCEGCHVYMLFVCAHICACMEAQGHH